MDHGDEMIQGMWKSRVWELAKAAKSPGGDVLVAEMQRAFRDVQRTPNANTRRWPLCSEEAERSRLSSIQESSVTWD